MLEAFDALGVVMAQSHADGWDLSYVKLSMKLPNDKQKQARLATVASRDRKRLKSKRKQKQPKKWSHQRELPDVRESETTLYVLSPLGSPIRR